uniref:Si:dkeyp-38g8.5 n=1 Tax=Gadus morhua TaxID=8049 RepID=A0A8C5FSF2_GADMO
MNTDGDDYSCTTSSISPLLLTHQHVSVVSCRCRAILKHMGLHTKLNYYQFLKICDPLNSNILMDNAMHGLLDSSAPIIALPPSDEDADFLPYKRRREHPRAPPRPPPLGGADASEIEVSLLDSGEEQQEEEEVELRRASWGMESERLALESERVSLEGERALMERERQLVAMETLGLQRERAGLEREEAGLGRQRAALERERTAVEREKALLARERAVLERERTELSRDRLAMERGRGRPARDAARLQDSFFGFVKLVQRCFPGVLRSH